MLIYLWTILHQSVSELVRKVFNIQKEVKEDLLKCKIKLTEEEIACMKQEKFRKLVNKSIKQLSEEYLKKHVEKHSKTENLKMQNYLMNFEITVEEKKILFLLRSRMYPVEKNFQNGNSDIQFTLCSKSEENQKHLLVCEEIVRRKN